ncbi:N-acetylmuramoyl-L-alanine amidase [Lacticaseibacillus hulanensis]|uniref:N-acetylmuramoyl-L-alanine amidase n=1 Tax=Lacticaseibacillus hulanensis TaxID=2493111 RepID=UPI000FD868F2|nr:N-acetylmuramoyl-L-alanine amidase [Lacticaseibacillus hulanensis]
MKNLHLNKLPLFIITAILLGVSLATTTVLAGTKQLTVRASVLNIRRGPGLAYDVMGQSQSGARLDVIGQRNSWYEVRLAGNKVGWVASWLVNNDDASTSAARVAQVNAQVNVRQYASTSAKLLGTLTAGTNVKVVYSQGDWSQIVYKNTAAWVSTQYLDLTGQTATVTSAQTAISKANTATQIKVTTNTNTHLREAGGINAAIIEDLAKGAKLTVINQDGDWYRVRAADGKTGYIASWVVSTPSDGKSSKAATSLAEATIVLDAGHGGSDPGTHANSGEYEKTYTLLTVDDIASQLRAAGANVVLTRSNDTYVDLAKRPIVAANVDADAFISIHFDSTPTANTGTGHTTYYYTKAKDYHLATYLSNSLTNLTTPSRGVAFGNYEVLRDNKQPSVLIELGYMNSDSDFKKFSKPSYRSRAALDIVNGLNKYFAAGYHR